MWHALRSLQIIRRSLPGWVVTVKVNLYLSLRELARQWKTNHRCHPTLSRDVWSLCGSNSRFLKRPKRLVCLLKIVSDLSTVYQAFRESRFNAQARSSVNRFQQLSSPLGFRVKLCYRLFYNHLLGRTKAEPRLLQTSMHWNSPTWRRPGSGESALVRQHHVFIGRGNWTARVRLVWDFRAFTRHKQIFCSVWSDWRWHILLVGLLIFKG